MEPQSSRRHPWLAGRRAAITTKHGKERQFGPALQNRAGIDLEVAHYDTDQLGTFTGTVPRTRSARETAARKARLAVELTDCSIGLGNEGSFVPHPAIPLLTSDREIVVMLDIERELEIIESVLTTRTNHSQTVVESPSAPADFLARVGFPDHALIVTPVDSLEPTASAIRDVSALTAALDRCFETATSAVIATDLRAHLNPTRQSTLVDLAGQLADRLSRSCPECGAPGWGVTAQEAGLPCGHCGTATRLVAIDTWTCASRRCDHFEQKRRTESAAQECCPYCNP